MTTNEPPPYPGDSGSGDDEGQDRPTPGTGGLPSYGSVEPPADGGYPPPPGAGAPGGYEQTGGPAQPFSAPEAVGWGWNKFRENIGAILLAGLLVVGISIAFGVVGTLITGADTGFDPNADTSTGATIASTLVQLVSTVVTILLSAIIIRAALDVADGGRFDLAAAFGKVNFVKAIIASIAVSVLVTIGFVLLIIPGIVLYFLTYFTMFFVVDDDSGSAFGAIRDSIKLIAANVGDSLLLALLNVGVIIVGFLALCVGLFVAYPVTLLASVYAFRRFRGQAVAAA